MALKFKAAGDDLLKEHYADLSTKPFFPSLIEYMKSGPVVPMVREPTVFLLTFVVSFFNDAHSQNQCVHT